LYGSTDGKDLKESVKDQEYLDILAKYSIEDWLKVLENWYINAPHLSLYGKPSAEFAEQQTEDEENRIEKQREDLGEEKLDQLQKKLDDAMAKNDAPIPNELLEGFKIPSASSIKFINVVTARNNDKSLSNEVQDYVNKDDSADVPLFIQFDRKLSCLYTIN
jgi:Zn-dependent M16 (insulinase) family peptidase